MTDRRHSLGSVQDALNMLTLLSYSIIAAFIIHRVASHTASNMMLMNIRWFKP